MTKLDHLYGASGEVADLTNKVNNLSQIAVKNNIANQVIPQQRINQAPTHDENIVRLYDTKYVRIINQTSALSTPNTVWEWRTTELENQKLHHFIIKVAVATVDYVFDWGGWIQDRNYKNMGPTVSFAKDANFNESCKIKVWVENNKFKMMCNIGIANCSVYLRKYPHR